MGATGISPIDMITEANQRHQVVVCFNCELSTLVTVKTHLYMQVFSKSYCPYCLKTKQLFDSLNIPAKVFELDVMDNGDDIQRALFELTKQRTG